METRQAAASALGFISRAVGIWDPSITEASKSTGETVEAVPTTQGAVPPMSLRDLDISHVLREGQLLLASSGKEYGKLAQLSEADLAKAQKDVLKNLGLGVGGGLDDIGVDVGAELAAGTVAQAEEKPDLAAVPSPRPGLPPPRFKPGGASGHASTFAADATASPSATSMSASTGTAPTSLPPATAAVASTGEAPPDVDPYAGLSARERNKLKRKRKAEEKAGIAPSQPTQPAAKRTKVASPAVADPSPQNVKAESPLEADVKTETADDGSRFVVDPAAKAKERERLGGQIQAKLDAEQSQTEIKAGEWPWKAVVERLAVGLLASNWETRHGAALGLRELLRLQASGGGKLGGVLRSQNDELHRIWIEDLAAKLLYVFALDRFGDYVSDQVRRGFAQSFDSAHTSSLSGGRSRPRNSRTGLGRLAPFDASSFIGRGRANPCRDGAPGQDRSSCRSEQAEDCLASATFRPPRAQIRRRRPGQRPCPGIAAGQIGGGGLEAGNHRAAQPDQASCRRGARRSSGS